MQQQITHAHYARSSIFYQGTPAQCRLGGAMHLHFCRRQKSPFRRRLLYTVSSSSCWPISLSLSLPVQELVWVNIRRCFQRNSDRRLPAPWLAARDAALLPIGCAHLAFAEKRCPRSLALYYTQLILVLDRTTGWFLASSALSGRWCVSDVSSSQLAPRPRASLTRPRAGS